MRRVHLDELPHPACPGGGFPFAVSGLHVAFAHALARFGILVEVDRLDPAVRQQILHRDAPDASHGDLVAGSRRVFHALDTP